MLGLTEKATIFILRFSEWVQLHLVGAKISTYCVARVPITDSALLPHCLSSARRQGCRDENDQVVHSFHRKRIFHGKTWSAVGGKTINWRNVEIFSFFHTRDSCMIILMNSGHWD